MNIFEKATRLRLRFATSRGAILTEDLWHLPLTGVNGCDLDSCAKAVNAEIKKEEEESFVKPRGEKSSELELRLEILKHVIKARLDEMDEKENAAVKATKRAKILQLIEDKKDDELKGKSTEELEKMLED